MFWCCGKVDVVAPGVPPSDNLKVDVAVAAKPIVLVSRADMECQIIVAKKDDTEVADAQAQAQALADAAEEELTNQTIVALLGIALIFGVAYMAINSEAETFYIEPPHEL